jgi:hypothetical protein
MKCWTVSSRNPAIGRIAGRPTRRAITPAQRLWSQRQRRYGQAIATETRAPAIRYAVSPRAWDRVPRQPDYPDDDAVRRVRRNGAIRWRGHTVYVNQALAGVPVGLIDNRRDLLRRPNRLSDNREQIRKAVIHVAGQICYRCSRLLKVGRVSNTTESWF